MTATEQLSRATTLHRPDVEVMAGSRDIDQSHNQRRDYNHA
jgi:hypothetical protein